MPRSSGWGDHLNVKNQVCFVFVFAHGVSVFVNSTKHA